MEEFMRRFRFDPKKSFLVGVERECFLTREGKIAPIASEVLARLPKSGRFGYELSACQLEERIGPCHVDEVGNELLANDMILSLAEKKLRFSRLHAEVGPEDMPLDVYPDPSGRYAEISRKMPREVLLAACQVIGTHVHIGMPNHEIALDIYNEVIKHCGMLCAKGDSSSGRRLAIYRIVAPEADPKPFGSWKHFHEVAIQKGFENDPRRCWTLIRISVHGTLEFRMFGATPSFETIVGWAKLCRNLCADIYRPSN